MTAVISDSRSKHIIRALCFGLALLAASPFVYSDPAPAKQPLDLVFLIDNSAATRAADPHHQLIPFLMGLAQGLEADTRVALVAYDELPSPLVPLTALRKGGGQAVADALRNLDFSARHTNSAVGLERAIYELKQGGRRGAKRAIVLQQSTSIDTGDRKQDGLFRRWAVEVLAEQARQVHIAMQVISLGPNADQPLGAALAERTSGTALTVAAAAQLPQAAGAMLRRLALNGPPSPRPEAGTATTEPVHTARVPTLPAPVPTPAAAEPKPVLIAPPERAGAPADAAPSDVRDLPPRASASATEQPATVSPAQTPAGAGGSPDTWTRVAFIALPVLLICGTGLGWYFWRRQRNGQPSHAATRLIDVSGASDRKSYAVTRIQQTPSDGQPAAGVPAEAQFASRERRCTERDTTAPTIVRPSG